MHEPISMRTKNYRHHRIELLSEVTNSGEWVAQAMIVITDAGKAKRIPIFGRRRATFDSKRGADALCSGIGQALDRWPPMGRQWTWLRSRATKWFLIHVSCCGNHRFHMHGPLGKWHRTATGLDQTLD
jgi:hypothetical protein